jgi:hypothetical protein
MRNFLSIVAHATVSRIWLIHDHDGDDVSKWYEVALEMDGPDQEMVQTLEFTVTYVEEDPKRFLEPLLDGMGWDGEIQDMHQGTGYGGLASTTAEEHDITQLTQQ